MSSDGQTMHILEQDSIFAIPVVSVCCPGFHSEPFGVVALCFEQDSSIFWFDDVHTLIITYFLSVVEGGKSLVKFFLYDRELPQTNLEWQMFMFCLPPHTDIQTVNR